MATICCVVRYVKKSWSVVQKDGFVLWWFGGEGQVPCCARDDKFILGGAVGFCCGNPRCRPEGTALQGQEDLR